ncbi:MAG: phosphoenolpyruvate carboxykinase (GTP) [archaeon]|jgi:phosphoenolpyruvate carboxykinase (GTP)
MNWKELTDSKSIAKLEAIGNKHVEEIVAKYSELCMPEKIIIFDDSKEDMEKVRKLDVEKKEEMPLTIKGHTIHYDGYYDQGRDAANTKILLKKGVHISKKLVTGEREECLEEVYKILEGIMKGKEMFVRFYCLGPQKSKFSLCALQITDSAYVSHSEDILYRQGYEEFKRLNGGKNFFYFIHSAGELNEDGTSKNVDKRRIYIDLEGNRVYTVNNQYAGNSVGLKKLALRLAIKKSHEEDWLCEHMFVLGAQRPGKGRTTYFSGAFPSACGKTSTAMIPGQKIIGDDIAYIRIGDDGTAYAVNVEQGIFGIIEDVNANDDPLIYHTLTTPRELIFSNILTNNGKPYWLGMKSETPLEGRNHSGQWSVGKKDAAGKEIALAHKNARYTMRIKELPNADSKIDDPNGVPISGIIYGGRDSDTSPPVVESLGWAHGVFIGAAVESETTAAKVGGVLGTRTHDPMANLDFLVVPLGTYIKNHLRFGENLSLPPKIFATNYFLKEEGNYLNDKVDKKVWLYWMEGRIHGEYKAINTPIGLIPYYEDLKEIYRESFGKDFSKEAYEKLFSIRVHKLVERLDRIEAIYAQEQSIPQAFKHQLSQQHHRLEEAKKQYGKETISPFDF